MIAQAQAELPNECCGLLAGRVARGVGRVAARYPLVNAAASPVEYLSEPQSMFDADRARRRDGLEFLAVYHSHPTSEPVPSRKDRERNYSEEVVNFIISLKGDEPAVRGWWLTAETFREADWEVII
jgi:proteasome lid subunit RPN8/RPN11